MCRPKILFQQEIHQINGTIQHWFLLCQGLSPPHLVHFCCSFVFSSAEDPVPEGSWILAVKKQQQTGWLYTHLPQKQIWGIICLCCVFWQDGNVPPTLPRTFEPITLCVRDSVAIKVDEGGAVGSTDGLTVTAASEELLKCCLNWGFKVISLHHLWFWHQTSECTHKMIKRKVNYSSKRRGDSAAHSFKCILQVKAAVFHARM